jgi:hypothetical protein
MLLSFFEPPEFFVNRRNRHLTRLIVLALTPYDRPRKRQLSPASRRLLISSIWCALSLNFGPNLIPDCLALCRPSLVRRRIKSLSNSATPDKTVSISLPIAVDVLAHGSARERKLASLAAVDFTMFSRSKVDLARRSSRVTTKVSPGPKDESKRVSCGRDSQVS